MKQIQIVAYGGPEVLTLVETEEPTAGDGELLIQVEAAGVNFSDVLRRRNTYFMPTPLPYVLGAEAVGKVVGAGSEAFPEGSRVLAILPQGGGYAEYLSVPAQYCVPLLPHINPMSACALFVQGSSAHLMLHQIAGPLSGKSVLVHAAAGGLGSLLVQLAKREGAQVIATASSPEKLAFAQSLGADAGVNYTEADWPQRIVEANGGKKVDLILETVGGEIYSQSFACLKTGGSMIVYGAASGEKGLVHSEHFVDESHNLLSFNLAHFIQNKPEQWQASQGAMIGLLAEGKIRVEVEHSYPLSEAAKAHRHLESRQTSGKVVLIP